MTSPPRPRRRTVRVPLTIVVVLALTAIAVLVRTVILDHDAGRHAPRPRPAPAVKPAPTTKPAPTVVDSPTCKPPAQHPDPVVLSPGTYGKTSWQVIGPQLAQLGYCVDTFADNTNETGDIKGGAHQLASFVDRVLSRTGAKRVSIVGHSEGGMMPRYYIKFLGGASKVRNLIGLAPSNHGTLNPLTFGGTLTGCVACAEQQTGSSFLTNLNAGDETTAPVNYTVIETRYDEVVLPYTSAYLNGPSARVTNVTLQDQCPNDFVGHLGIATDPVALQWVQQALARNAPADPAFTPQC